MVKLNELEVLRQICIREMNDLDKFRCRTPLTQIDQEKNAEYRSWKERLVKIEYKMKKIAINEIRFL
jgi:hypothetical protein